MLLHVEKDFKKEDIKTPLSSNVIQPFFKYLKLKGTGLDDEQIRRCVAFTCAYFDKQESFSSGLLYSKSLSKGHEGTFQLLRGLFSPRVEGLGLAVESKPPIHQSIEKSFFFEVLCSTQI